MPWYKPNLDNKSWIELSNMTWSELKMAEEDNMFRLYIMHNAKMVYKAIESGIKESFFDSHADAYPEVRRFLEVHILKRTISGEEDPYVTINEAEVLLQENKKEKLKEISDKFKEEK